MAEIYYGDVNYILIELLQIVLCLTVFYALDTYKTNEVYQCEVKRGGEIVWTRFFYTTLN